MSDPKCPNCDITEKPQKYHVRYGDMPNDVRTGVRLWRCPECDHTTQSADEYLRTMK